MIDSETDPPLIEAEIDQDPHVGRANVSEALDVAENSDSQEEVFVYALGRILPRFPSLGLEKEYAQVAGRSDTAGLTDLQTLQSVLSTQENRYLARELCWVFVIEGLDSYILIPRDPSDLDLLVGVVGLVLVPSMLTSLLALPGRWQGRRCAMDWSRQSSYLIRSTRLTASH